MTKITIEYDGDEMMANVNLSDDDHINAVLKVFSLIQTDFLSNQHNETTIEYEVCEL